MDLTMYKSILGGGQKNLGQIGRNKSEKIMNIVFNRDPAYKKVYVLTKEGWKWTDAHYSMHTVPSISKDDVDYYLQFRPYEHYPIGSYVIIPDDTSIDINLNEEEIDNPFLQPVNQRTQWYVIVDKIDTDTFVRYSVLKCNWNFQWIFNGKLYECFGMIRNANSYTSGVWSAEYSDALDNVTGFWIPDTYYVYGDDLEKLGLCDTRTLTHDLRIMLTTNVLDPKIYAVSKVNELSPKGVLKITAKQDEFYPARDNTDLMLCDYYDAMGNPLLTNATFEDIVGDHEILSMYIDEFGELVQTSSLITTLYLSKTQYYKVMLPKQNENIIWDIVCVTEGVLNGSYYERLIKINSYNNDTVAIKPSKALSLVGQQFELSAQTADGMLLGKIKVEVCS